MGEQNEWRHGECKKDRENGIVELLKIADSISWKCLRRFLPYHTQKLNKHPHLHQLAARGSGSAFN